MPYSLVPLQLVTIDFKEPLFFGESNTGFHGIKKISFLLRRRVVFDESFKFFVANMLLKHLLLIFGHIGDGKATGDLVLI